MKSVCIFTSGHPAYDDRIFYKEARSLKKVGLDVTLICSTGKHNAVAEGIRVQGFSIDPFLIRIVIGRIMKIMNFVKLALQERYDVYHCHEFGPLISAYIARCIRSILRGNRNMIVYDVHEWFPWSLSWEPGNPLTKKIRTGFYHQLHSFLCNRTDYIILNEKLKLPLFRSILAHSRVAIVENFPPLDLFDVSIKEFQRSHFVIAYAGGLSRERGIYELARATQIFSQESGITPCLLLVGDFYSLVERKKFLRSFANANFKLEFTGWIPHPQVPLFLSDADVCVIPWQRTEKFSRSLPVKLYEYMALSKPVIASDFGETKKVVDNTGCGILIDPSNPDEIAYAISHYYNNPDEMHDHGAKGRHWVEKEFNWAESEKKLLSVYSNLGSDCNHVR